MTGQVRSPGGAPAPWRALQTHVGAIRDLAPSPVHGTRSCQRCPSSSPGSPDRTPSAAAGGSKQKGMDNSARRSSRWGWKASGIRRLPSDPSPRDIPREAGLPRPPARSQPGFPSSLPPLPSPTPGFKVLPRGVREPEPDAAPSRAPAHAGVHAARHVRGGGVGGGGRPRGCGLPEQRACALAPAPAALGSRRGGAGGSGRAAGAAGSGVAGGGRAGTGDRTRAGTRPRTAAPHPVPLRPGGPARDRHFSRIKAGSRRGARGQPDAAVSEPPAWVRGRSAALGGPRSGRGLGRAGGARLGCTRRRRRQDAGQTAVCLP